MIYFIGNVTSYICIYVNYLLIEIEEEIEKKQYFILFFEQCIMASLFCYSRVSVSFYG